MSILNRRGTLFVSLLGLMVPDAEVLSVASEILSSLPIGEFQIKLNHRRQGRLAL